MRRILAFQQLQRSAISKKKICRSLGINKRDFSEMLKSDPLSGPDQDAAKPASNSARLDLYSSFLLDAGQFQQFGTSGIYSYASDPVSFPFSTSSLNLSNLSALRATGREVFESEHPEDQLTLLIRSTTQLADDGYAWTVLGAIPPQVLALMKKVMPTANWTHLMWDRAYDHSMPSACLASLCKLHHDLSHRGIACENTGQALAVVAAHVLQLRQARDGARARIARVDQVERFAPSPRWARIVSLIEESASSHVDLPPETLAELTAAKDPLPLAWCGGAPIEAKSVEEMRSFPASRLSDLDVDDPSLAYRGLKELHSRSPQQIIEAIPTDGFRSDLRDILASLSDESSENEEIPPEKLARAKGRRKKRFQHQFGDYMVELGKLVAGGLTLESRHAESISESLRFVVISRRLPICPATSVPRAALFLRGDSEAMVTIDTWPLFHAIHTLASYAWLGGCIGNLKRLNSLCRQRKLSDIEGVSGLPASFDLKTVVLHLTKIFPVPLLIHAIAADIPEGIERTVSIVIDAITKSEEKLSPKMRSWFRCNLALIKGRAAPLVAESLLLLAVRTIQTGVEDKESPFSVCIDIEDFVRFVGTLASQLTSPLSPRESRPQKRKDPDDNPQGYSIESMAGDCAHDTADISEVLRQLIQTNSSPEQAAQLLYSSLEYYDGDRHFLAEEYSGQIREIAEDLGASSEERYVARKLLENFNQLSGIKSAVEPLPSRSCFGR